MTRWKIRVGDRFTLIINLYHMDGYSVIDDGFK